MRKTLCTKRTCLNFFMVRYDILIDCLSYSEGNSMWGQNIILYAIGKAYHMKFIL